MPSAWKYAGDAAQKSAVPRRSACFASSAYILEVLRVLLRAHQQEHAVGQAAVHRDRVDGRDVLERRNGLETGDKPAQEL